MGGAGSGRLPSAETILRREAEQFLEARGNVSSIELPNLSGVQQTALRTSSEITTTYLPTSLSGSLGTLYVPLTLSGSTTMPNNSIIFVSGGKYHGQTNLMSFSGSNVGINITNPESKFHVKLGTNLNFRLDPVSSRIRIAGINDAGSDNANLNITANSVIFPSIGTTTTAANAFLDSGNSNDLLRSTSSLRYKKDVAPLALNEAENIVLNANPVSFRGLADDKESIGLIAEEMELLDKRTVTFDDQGRADWVQYPHLVAPLIKVVQDLKKRIEVLEAK